MWTLFTSPQLNCQRKPATTCTEISIEWLGHSQTEVTSPMDKIHSTLKRHSHGENYQKQLIEVRELNALSCFTISNSTPSRMQRHSTKVVPTIDSHLINVRVTSIQLHHIFAKRQPNWNESAIAKLAEKGRKKKMRENFRIALHACRGRSVYKHWKDSFATPFNCSIFQLQYEQWTWPVVRHAGNVRNTGTVTQGTQHKIENYVIIIHISFCWYPSFKFILCGSAASSGTTQPMWEQERPRLFMASKTRTIAPNNLNPIYVYI